jgi:hypothetical protein
MLRSTLGHPIILKRRSDLPDPVTLATGVYTSTEWTQWEDCNVKGPTNLCGILWSELGDCFPNQEFALKWTVSDNCETVDIQLYRVVLSPTHTPTLVAEWTAESREWYAGTITADDEETGGTVTIENCESGVDAWTETETESIMIQATLIHSGTPIRCMFGYGNSVCGGTWTGCSSASTGNVNWMHSLLYGKVVIQVSTGGDAPFAARNFTTELSDGVDEWYVELDETIATTVSGYSWKFKRVYNCSGCGGGGGDPPDDICDPGCWPLCVICPTPLSMALVVTQDPSCCLHGSFGLTYSSGDNWFYLSAAVGGPSGVCGEITAFKMTCVDASHVTLQITYIDVNGTTTSSSTTVSASCSGGEFETAPVDIGSGVFFPGLCEGGIGKGANIRVVSV